MRGKDYEYDGSDAGVANAPYPMKGTGPFVHTDPRDRPPEIFGGRNVLHFFRGQDAVSFAADHSAALAWLQQMRSLLLRPLPSRERARRHVQQTQIG